MSENDRGITLVEVLVVIMVLGVLATVTTIAISGTTSTASSSACDADRATVERAAAAWRTQHPGETVTLAALVEDRFLRSTSEMHDLSGDGTAVGTGRCSGHGSGDTPRPGAGPPAERPGRPTDPPGRSGNTPATTAGPPEPVRLTRLPR